MKAVIQRVSSAHVLVDNKQVSRIDTGVLVLLGVAKNDTAADVAYLVDKIVHLRIFEDLRGKMNLSLKDISGQLLVVSQFTLAGNCRKGRRPSFDSAAPPAVAESLYRQFIETARKFGIVVAGGQFGAMMTIHLANHGPATFILESPPP